MVNLSVVIKRPLMTEKSMEASALNCYTFVVDKGANKNQIKEAVEKGFGVKVKKVRTMLTRKAAKILKNHRKLRGKLMKKAIVELEKGEKLDIYESKGK